MPSADAKVLVLTPMKSAERYLDRYFTGLSRLSYPRRLTSLGILEGDSTDDTFAAVEARLAAEDFCRKTLVRKDFGFHMPADVPRYAAVFQPTRRAILARARNHLLFHALDDEDWVLWLDVDVISYPQDIIEQLLSIGHDIVHPHCVTTPGGPSFDLNAWRDRGRQRMQDLRGQGRVRLDAVGGTMLLVRADRHRDGLIFPPFFYGSRSRWVRDQQL
jgi:glycosyltransferase involved in cell wall biosynthesis